jgi:hypothetical protein
MTQAEFPGFIEGAGGSLGNWLRMTIQVEKTMSLARLNVLALLLTALVMANSGCALLAAGAAGGVAADEIGEDDGRFDPLENTEVGEEVYE